LLSVAVGRARGFGRGGDITRVRLDTWSIGLDVASLFEIRDGLVVANVYDTSTYRLRPIGRVTVVAPEVTGIRGVLRELLDKLVSVVPEGGYEIVENTELLPIDIQIALKRLGEVIVTVVQNVLYERYRHEVRETIPIRSLLVACYPRVTEIRIKRSGVTDNDYVHIYYDCEPPYSEVEYHPSVDVLQVTVRRRRSGRIMTIEAVLYTIARAVRGPR
jgi:hypothetical protein